MVLRSELVQLFDIRFVCLRHSCLGRQWEAGSMASPSPGARASAASCTSKEGKLTREGRRVCVCFSHFGFITSVLLSTPPDTIFNLPCRANPYVYFSWWRERIVVTRSCVRIPVYSQARLGYFYAVWTFLDAQTSKLFFDTKL